MGGRCAWITLTSVLLFADGCSLVFVKRVPKGPLEPQPPVECTASVAAPVVDTLLAAGSLTGGILMATDSCSSSGWFGSICTAQKAGGAGLIAAGVGLAAVGIYGFLATGECRGVEATQLACLSGVERSCQALKERSPPLLPAMSATGRLRQVLRRQPTNAEPVVSRRSSSAEGSSSGRSSTARPILESGAEGPLCRVIPLPSITAANLAEAGWQRQTRQASEGASTRSPRTRRRANA